MTWGPALSGADRRWCEESSERKKKRERIGIYTPVGVEVEVEADTRVESSVQVEEDRSELWCVVNIELGEDGDWRGN